VYSSAEVVRAKREREREREREKEEKAFSSVPSLSIIHAQEFKGHKHVGHFTSQFFEVLDAKSLQLFTKGDVLLLLKHCTAFWDGHSVQALTAQGKEKIMEICKQWMKSGNESCVGFA
jgi:hypothetical protein